MGGLGDVIGASLRLGSTLWRDLLANPDALRFQLAVWIVVLAGALALDPAHVLVTAVLLGLGFVLGTGNGAVFEIVAKRFPRDAGLVGGLVGAVGALGGTVLPVAQGFAQDLVGSYVVGFLLLGGLALVAWILDRRIASHPQDAGVR